MLNNLKIKALGLLVLLVPLRGYPQNMKVNFQNNEVIYHLFQRSFYDSNGDLNGDFNGINEKLAYLQDLGVTSIMLVPVVESAFYHNYFSSDFDKTDPQYGTRQEFINLVREIHKRGMKIYLDMETQYVTEDHIWFKDSYNNPKSPYSEYIVYNDTANLKPESIIFGITELYGYNGVKKRIALVNLNSKKVKDYNYKLFKSFMDPNNDGNFDDGVDGFRLDHMMDDLDGKGKLVNLYANFWAPLIDQLKAVNPKLKIVAEQANWASYGYEYFNQGHVDRVFAFNLQRAIASFDKNKIINAADSTLNLTPEGHQQVVFLENHDMPRFASVVKKDPGKLRVGAAITLLINDLPAIYYGQELGMTGSGGFNKYGKTDANDIPQREAFEWYKSDTGKGMAVWYKGTGPWWDQTNLVPNDGISFEEEKADPNSLWHFYRTILHLRKASDVLASGKYENLKNNNDHVFSFRRYGNNHAVIVIVNLSDAAQDVKVNIAGTPKNTVTNKLYGNSKLMVDAAGTLSGSLSPYAIDVIEIK
jgi:glycosidase